MSESNKANMREVIGGIASTLTEQTTRDMPIPLGDSSYAVTQVGYTDGDPEIWLRLNTDEVWILCARQLGTDRRHVGRDDEDAVLDSYKQFIGLLESKKHAVRYAKSLGIEDENLALQTYYEAVLSDDERECWDRWSPGGYATKQEVAIVNRRYRG